MFNPCFLIQRNLYPQFTPDGMDSVGITESQNPSAAVSRTNSDEELIKERVAKPNVEFSSLESLLISKTEHAATSGGISDGIWERDMNLLMFNPGEPFQRNVEKNTADLAEVESTRTVGGNSPDEYDWASKQDMLQGKIIDSSFEEQTYKNTTLVGRQKVAYGTVPEVDANARDKTKRKSVKKESKKQGAPESPHLMYDANYRGVLVTGSENSSKPEEDEKTGEMGIYGETHLVYDSNNRGMYSIIFCNLMLAVARFNITVHVYDLIFNTE